MIANAVFFTLAVMLGFAFWLVGELKYMVPSCSTKGTGRTPLTSVAFWISAN